MKKYAIFSDIHGNYEALESILNDINQKCFDEIFYLGDAIGIGPDSKKCLELLKKNNVNFALGDYELYCLYGTDINNSLSQEEKEYFNRLKSSLDEQDTEYLKQGKLYYECSIDYEDSYFNKRILFSHFLIEDKNKIYAFEENNLKHDINQWLKHNDEYLYIFIGHEHESYSEDEVEGAGGNFEQATGVLSNIWLVGSSGCTKNNKTTYTELVINKSISVTKVCLEYDRNKYLEKLNSFKTNVY